MFPPLKITKKTGNESFENTGINDVTLVDFWSWAYSDLINNTERGKLAEFIVALAIGANNGLSGSWEKYDLLSPEGIRIEVKSSSYIQTWEQKKESKIIFSIRPTFGWDSVTSEYDKQKRRQSDVYVFCLLNHKDQATINPLDLNQWEFYVMPTAVLDKILLTQKSISLNRLIKLGALRCGFKNLNEIIVSIRI